MDDHEFSPCELEAFLRSELRILRQAIAALPAQQAERFRDVLESAHLLELQLDMDNMTL